MPVAGLRADLDQLRFREAAARDGYVLDLIQATPLRGAPERAEELVRREADQGVEHKSWERGQYLLDHAGKVGFAHREIALREDRAVRGKQRLPHDLVIFPS